MTQQPHNHFVMSQRPSEVTAAIDRLREHAFDLCAEAMDRGLDAPPEAIDIFTLINEINDFRKVTGHE